MYKCEKSDIRRCHEERRIFSLSTILPTILQFSFIFENRTTLWINEVFNHGEYRGVLGKWEKKRFVFKMRRKRQDIFLDIRKREREGEREEEYKVAKLPKLRAFLVPPFSDAGVISKNIRSWVRLRRVFSIYLFLSFSGYTPTSFRYFRYELSFHVRAHRLRREVVGRGKINWRAQAT